MHFKASFPTVLTFGAAQGRHEAAWVHKRPGGDGSLRLSRYTTLESKSICEGSSTAVLGADKGNVEDYRELVLCTGLWGEARLAEVPRSDVLGSRDYIAATLLHDVLLLAPRGKTRKFNDRCKTIQSTVAQALHDGEEVCVPVNCGKMLIHPSPPLL